MPETNHQQSIESEKEAAPLPKSRFIEPDKVAKLANIPAKLGIIGALLYVLLLLRQDVRDMTEQIHTSYSKQIDVQADLYRRLADSLDAVSLACTQTRAHSNSTQKRAMVSGR